MTAWRNDRHGDTADLGHGLTLGVYWEGTERLPADEPRYNVSVFGARLKVRSKSAEDGKRRAERVAKEWLKDALAKLDTVKPESTQER